MGKPLMNERHSVWLAPACLLVVCVASVHAEERNYWRHSHGHFANTKGNRWEEKKDDDTYHFVETDRTDHYVELYDKSRDCTVRLFSDRCMVKADFTNNKFEKFYEGHWGN